MSHLPLRLERPVFAASKCLAGVGPFRTREVRDEPRPLWVIAICGRWRPSERVRGGPATTSTPGRDDRAVRSWPEASRTAGRVELRVVSERSRKPVAGCRTRMARSLRPTGVSCRGHREQRSVQQPRPRGAFVTGHVLPSCASPYDCLSVTRSGPNRRGELPVTPCDMKRGPIAACRTHTA